MPASVESIEVNVAPDVAYQRLCRFEEFPRFMQDVRSIHPHDETHLHWRAKRGDTELEWDAEVIQRIPSRCIAWRNTTGPRHEGRVTINAVGPQTTRITLQIVTGDDDGEDRMELACADDLARFKKLIETETPGGPPSSSIPGAGMHS